MILHGNRLALIHSVLLLVVLFVYSGCSSQVIDNDSPAEAQYAEGERLLKKNRFIEAEERFRILKNRYPYSKLAAMATLRIGDVHFEEETFVEAAAAYKVFRELYPKHEMGAYALYRIGESFYNLLPSAIDRDQEPADSAINAYQQLLKEYPDCSQKAEAQKKIHELQQKIAEKELYVGNFYFKRESYQSAALRYTYLLDHYPEFDQNDSVLIKLAHSNERIGEIEKARENINKLRSGFPKSPYLAEADALEKSLK